PHAVISLVCNEEISCCVTRDSERKKDPRQSGRTAITGEAGKAGAGNSADHAIWGYLPDSTVVSICDEQIAGIVQGCAGRATQLGRRCRTSVAAEPWDSRTCRDT